MDVNKIVKMEIAKLYICFRLYLRMAFYFLRFLLYPFHQMDIMMAECKTVSSMSNTLNE